MFLLKSVFINKKSSRGDYFKKLPITLHQKWAFIQFSQNCFRGRLRKRHCKVLQAKVRTQSFYKKPNYFIRFSHVIRRKAKKTLFLFITRKRKKRLIKVLKVARYSNTKLVSRFLKFIKPFKSHVSNQRRHSVRNSAGRKKLFNNWRTRRRLANVYKLWYHFFAKRLLVASSSKKKRWVFNFRVSYNKVFVTKKKNRGMLCFKEAALLRKLVLVLLKKRTLKSIYSDWQFQKFIRSNLSQKKHIINFLKSFLYVRPYRRCSPKKNKLFNNFSRHYFLKKLRRTKFFFFLRQLVFTGSRVKNFFNLKKFFLKQRFRVLKKFAWVLNGFTFFSRSTSRKPFLSLLLQKLRLVKRLKVSLRFVIKFFLKKQNYNFVFLILKKFYNRRNKLRIFLISFLKRNCVIPIIKQKNVFVLFKLIFLKIRKLDLAIFKLWSLVFGKAQCLKKVINYTGCKKTNKFFITRKSLVFAKLQKVLHHFLLVIDHRRKFFIATPRRKVFFKYSDTALVSSIDFKQLLIDHRARLDSTNLAENVSRVTQKDFRVLNFLPETGFFYLFLIRSFTKKGLLSRSYNFFFKYSFYSKLFFLQQVFNFVYMFFCNNISNFFIDFSINFTPISTQNVLFFLSKNLDFIKQFLLVLQEIFFGPLFVFSLSKKNDQQNIFVLETICVFLHYCTFEFPKISLFNYVSSLPNITGTNFWVFFSSSFISEFLSKFECFVEFKPWQKSGKTHQVPIFIKNQQRRKFYFLKFFSQALLNRIEYSQINRILFELSDFMLGVGLTVIKFTQFRESLQNTRPFLKYFKFLL